MKIESFTIKNYCSIKKLKIDNLNPVNVFFGKNNVGKSNIIRALHLALYCLKNDEIYLPDTMFYNRNIYKPIEITLNLNFEEDFYDTEKTNRSLSEKINNVIWPFEDKKILDNGKIDEFFENSLIFKPLKKLCLKVSIDFNEETSDIKVSIKDLESDYTFDYGEYKVLFNRVNNIITDEKISDVKRILDFIKSELSTLGLEDYVDSYHERRFIDDSSVNDFIERLKYHISRRIEHPEKRRQAFLIVDRAKDSFEDSTHNLSTNITNVFNVVGEYFDKISDNFILIPNKVYLPKVPFRSKGESRIEIFDTEKFGDKLISLIDSPNKKERKLIQKFNSIFSKSYKILGEIEIRKFQKRLFTIFDTGFTALPIENQGQGIQDLFLYLSNMILFDSTIVAIEEPEGGLSTENQRILHNIIEDVYSGSDKQVFISSHSEEFETPNSYIIEMSKEGTKEISKIENGKEFAEKIDEVLIKRKLEEEKKQYEVLLKDVAEKQMALDILNYIEELDDKDKFDSEEISKELGYQKDKVERILSEMTRRRE